MFYSTGQPLGYSIQTAEIDAGAVTAVKLATDAVETLKIKAKNVTLAKIEDVAAARLIVGSAGNLPVSVDITGDITIGNTGVTAIGTDKVTQGMIEDNAIDLTRMASGTDGNLITYDTSGNPAAVATGNANQVLTSNGAGAAPSFQSLAIDTTNLELNVAVNNLEIIELQANASVSPIDHDTVIVETFSDATGYNNYVNIDNTGATFNSNKYTRVTSSSGENFQTGADNYMDISNGTTMAAMIFKSNGGLLTQIEISIKKGGSPDADLNIQVWNVDSSTNKPTNKIADFADILASNVTTSYVFLSSAGSIALVGKKYAIVIGSTGLSTGEFDWYEDTGNGYANGGRTVSSNGGSSWGSHAAGEDMYFKNTYSSYTEDKIIEIDLPTITGTISHTQLVVNDIDRETGDEIIYDIIDTDGVEDTSQVLDTKNTLSNPDGTKITDGILRIYLNGKPSSPSAGVPSIRTFALKLWKS